MLALLHKIGKTKPEKVVFVCVLNESSLRNNVCQTIFLNVKYQDLCATINPSTTKISKINYLEET